MFQQDLNPVGGSLALSALCAAIPLVTLFVLLGGLRLKAWVAGLISLGVALVIAVALFKMPVGQALLAGTEGAAFGFFPILWIVINAIWVYNLTVASGHFDVLRRSFEKVSPDQRIQAIIIAFCFGALLEALAGFGTPVAISVVMLMALGFQPLKAAEVALIANTAPVAFGALATPIVTLAAVTSGVSDDPRLNVDTLGGDGRPADPDPGGAGAARAGLRRRRQARRASDVAAVHRLRRRLRHRPVRGRQLHLGAAGRHHRRPGRRRPPWSRLLRVWKPAHELTAAEVDAETEAEDGATGSGAGSTRRQPSGVSTSVTSSTGRGATATARDSATSDSTADVVRAYAPYAVIIAIFSITNIPAVKEFLAEKPFTYAFAWPGLEVLNTAGEPVATTMYTFNWLPAAGTLMIFAGLITMVILKLSPAQRVQDLRSRPTSS